MRITFSFVILLFGWMLFFLAIVRLDQDVGETFFLSHLSLFLILRFALIQLHDFSAVNLTFIGIELSSYFLSFGYCVKMRPVALATNIVKCNKQPTFSVSALVQLILFFHGELCGISCSTE